MARKVAVALFLLALVAVGQSVSVSGRLSAFGEKKGIISSIKKGVIKGISGSLKTFAQGKALDVPAPIEKYLIECFPSAAPGAKCPAANQLTALAGKLGAIVLEQVKTLFKTATDAVDPKTSAENEVLSDEQEGADSRFMDLKLPRFAAGMRWPKTGPGSLTQVAYCWENGVTWWNKIFFLWAMRIVRASSTNLRFEKVDCGAAGHKIKLGNNNGRCGTQAGGYRGAGNPTAGTPGAAGKPSTDQFIRCDFTAFNRYSGAHEFFHALGFGHTQCRSDRDHYLVVAKNAGHQWRIIGNNEGTFDFDSVMLYPPSARGKPKTKPKAGYKGTPKNMGQRSKLSAEDVRILNHVYA